MKPRWVAGVGPRAHNSFKLFKEFKTFKPFNPSEWNLTI
jgi:hypothetical protein